MNKLFYLLLIFAFLFSGILIASFFIPQTIIIESPEAYLFNSSNSSSLVLNDEPESPLYLKTISDIRDNFILDNKTFFGNKSFNNEG